jgi:uroporphyrinogen decarboxylase
VHTDKNLIEQALSGSKTHRPPIWLMRQAGRILPEYRAIRQKHSMLDLIRIPELAAEVTLQPIRRFSPDAAIIFADILNPLIGIGFNLEFIEKRGPVIQNPVKKIADVGKLIPFNPEVHVSYTLEAIKIVKNELGIKTPVLGFSGAPFTLSYYIIEGQATKEPLNTKAAMYSDLWSPLQDKLTDLVISYFKAQIDSGVSAVQLFDSWVGHLSAFQYSKFVLPWLKKIVSELKRYSNTPVIYFSMSTSGLLKEISEIGCQVLSVDWRVSLPNVLKEVPHITALQGNIDPSLLRLPWNFVLPEVKDILEQARFLSCGYICNVGHGVHPDSNLDTVSNFIEFVKGIRLA